MGSPYTGSAVQMLYSEDEYVWTMDEEACKTAKRELCEDETTRTKGLRQLRTWIKDHPSIRNCRLDANFLLRFLRMKRFNQKEAREVLVKYLEMRQDSPQWFHGLDIEDEELHHLVSQGFVFALPDRDDEGRRVIFSRGGTFDPSRHDNSHVMRAVMLTCEGLLEDEMSQIKGFTYVFDEKGLGLSHLTIWTPSEVSKVFKCCERSMPMRHKQIHIVNLNFLLYTVLEFAKTLLSCKLRYRIQAHSDPSKIAQKLPASILPKEYGGTIPMSDMIDLWKKELLTKRDRLLALDKIVIKNSSKLICTQDADTELIKSSIRDLEID